MGTVLKGGTVVELEPAHVEVADLRIEGDRIVARGSDLPVSPDDEGVSAAGKLVFPGLVSAHQQLHWSLLRGLPPQRGLTYTDALEKVTWAFEKALDLDAVQTAGLAGGLEALEAGTTTVMSLHSSPRCISGSLLRLARGLHEVGVRAVLAYAVGDQHGRTARDAGLEECLHFAAKAKGCFRGRVGLSPLFTVGDEALAQAGEVLRQISPSLHLPLAEDPTDEKLSLERFGASPVSRLLAANLLSPQSAVAHLGHLAWPDLAQLLATGAWAVHTPRSNMQREVGYAPALKFGARGALGADTFSADMFAEAHVAFLRSQEAGQPIDVLRFLANGHRMASQAFGLPIGPLREGAAADLLLLDYRPVVPVTAETLATHVATGLNARHVEAVMVDGAWRMWSRRPLTVNPDFVSEYAREVALAVWDRMQASDGAPL